MKLLVREWKRVPGCRMEKPFALWSSRCEVAPRSLHSVVTDELSTSPQFIDSSRFIFCETVSSSHWSSSFWLQGFGVSSTSCESQLDFQLLSSVEALHFNESSATLPYLFCDCCKNSFSTLTLSADLLIS